MKKLESNREKIALYESVSNECPNDRVFIITYDDDYVINGWVMDPLENIYCPEQIKIPPTFPRILKSYAKAAIRTQPYDLLRWTVAYFCALANGEEPPVKVKFPSFRRIVSYSFTVGGCFKL